MKMILLMLLATLLCAEPNRSALESIESDAIVFGTGLNRIYVFVDPLCPNSRNLIEAIETNQKLQRENTYFVFLYRLKMFKSDTTINAIYQAKDRKKALLDVMINQLPVTTQENDSAREIRKRIKRVAIQIPMKHRPYLILFPHGSSYCKVSEGKAACMLQVKN